MENTGLLNDLRFVTEFADELHSVMSSEGAASLQIGTLHNGHIIEMIIVRPLTPLT